MRRAGKRVVAVAMSGGIDSAVSALLLKQQGHQCVGVFMKNWDPQDEEDQRACTTDRDRQDMRAVCRHLDIPTFDVEFIREYWSDVFVPFLEAYKTGKETPNPDVLCNKTVKFRHFRSHVLDTLQADAMATGHYARLVAATPSPLPPLSSPPPSSSSSSSGPACPVLLRGVDPAKDQSYFLSMTPGESFHDVLFPVGGLTKVRQLAAQHLPNLPVLSKPESMGLCFVGKRDLASFLGGYLTLTPGRFVDVDTGQAVGEHRGRELYTVGQGARIGGHADRYFVTFRNSREGEVTGEAGDVWVVRGADHPLLFSSSVTLHSRDLSWVGGRVPDCLQPSAQASRARPLHFKARYIQPLEACTASIEQHAGGAYTVTVRFDVPHRAITAGQVLALYDGEVCLGGGVIR